MILCVLLIVLAVFCLSAGAGFWLTFLFFLAGILGLWIAFRVATGGACLILDEAGFTKKTVFTSHRVDWVGVSAFAVAETWPKVAGFAKKVVAFRRLDAEEPDMFSAITDPFNPAKGFGHNYDMEPDHLADLLNDYRAAALKASMQGEEGQKTSEISPQGDY
ncbi:hypothetical protein GCM10011342_13740 [Aquisalinus flavus]|uniref:Uncharacterized protein n=1 Tax=Aquisalinus flavus TaxID=1526572 RepID=A0A8J2V2X9_9PROT|nr:hypothetical protein GCM10011342_13740 [Aquisalinus flavus]